MLLFWLLSSSCRCNTRMLSRIITIIASLFGHCYFATTTQFVAAHEPLRDERSQQQRYTRLLQIQVSEDKPQFIQKHHDKAVRIQNLHSFVRNKHGNEHYSNTNATMDNDTTTNTKGRGGVAIAEQLLLQKPHRTTSTLKNTMNEEQLRKKEEQEDEEELIQIMEEITNSSNTSILESNEAYIPTEFASDFETFSIYSWHRRPFPRWQKYPYDNEPTIMDSLLDYVQALSEDFGKVDRAIKKHDQQQLHTSDHNYGGFMGKLPEILYVLTSHGLYVSETSRQILASLNHSSSSSSSSSSVSGGSSSNNGVYNKFVTTHQLLTRAYNTVEEQLTTTKSSTIRMKFPSLYQTLMIERQSIPFFVWHGPYTGCNYHNWKNHTTTKTNKIKANISQNHTVLLFTNTAHLQCNYTFPIPHDHMIQDVYENGTEWHEVSKHEEPYRTTWKEKIPKLVWRGGLVVGSENKQRFPKYLKNDKNDNDMYQNGPRYELYQFMKSETVVTNQTLSNMFDIQFTHLSFNKKMKKIQYANGTTKELDLQLDDFSYEDSSSYYNAKTISSSSFLRKYRAILDINDGTSSTRFGKLLCYKSVVLKVESPYVNYFEYKSSTSSSLSSSSSSVPTLQPWVHYIPVRNDLQDLISKTQYVLNDKNEERITQIIHNANTWCYGHMTYPSITYDMISILDTYVQTLNEYSKQWKQQWNTIESKILDRDHNNNSSHRHPLQMKIISATAEMK